MFKDNFTAPFKFKPDDDILELYVSESFCEQGLSAEFCSVEKVDFLTLKNIKFLKKFDKIILNGILPHLSKIFCGENQVDDFVNFIKKLLKPNGQVFLLFKDKTEANILLEFFTYAKLYCVFPSVLSCKAIAEQNVIDSDDVNFKNTMSYQNFDKRYFSFLLVLSDKEPLYQPVFVKFLPNICTNIVYDLNRKVKFIEKIHTTEERVNYFQFIHNNYLRESERLKKLGVNNISFAKCEMCDNTLRMEYIDGTLLSSEFFDLVQNGDFEKLALFFMEYKKIIDTLYQDYTICDVRDFKYGQIFSWLDNPVTKCVKGGNYDLHFNNIFKTEDGNFVIIDYDKICPFEMPLKYILLKSLDNIFRNAYQTDKGFEFLLTLFEISEREYFKYCEFNKKYKTYIDNVSYFIAGFAS